MVTFSAGVFAYMAALDLGLPVWRDWPAGDATDFGVVTAILVWHLLKEIRDGRA